MVKLLCTREHALKYSRAVRSSVRRLDRPRSQGITYYTAYVDVTDYGGDQNEVKIAFHRDRGVDLCGTIYYCL